MMLLDRFRMKVVRQHAFCAVVSQTLPIDLDGCSL